MTSHALQTDDRELAARSNDGIDVRLWWRPADDEVLLQVDDAKLGVRFLLPVPADEALQAFHHPFAYAATPDVRAPRLVAEAQR